ncbi:MAG: sulfotransferase family protein [Flavobacteriales bacterium]
MKVDFFIVGAPKAGTTSLYHYLNEHPEISMSSQKEPDYFSDADIQNEGMYYGKNRIDTIKKYHSLFDDNSESKLKGEASVSYLFYKNVPQKIKSYNPEAKIIIMLRDPIDRAFSHYLMDYRLGLVSDSFEDIIDQKSVHKNAKLFYQQYIELSEYTNQVKRYLNVFDGKEILFIEYEDLKKDALGIVKKTYLFLGVNQVYRPDVNKKHNTYTMPKNSIIRFIYSFVILRNILSFFFQKNLVNRLKIVLFKNDKKPKLLDKTRDRLKQFFTNDVNKLAKMLNKDFSRWINLD